MELIIIGVIIFFVVRHFKKKKEQQNEAGMNTYSAPAAGSRAEKSAIKEFNSHLSSATSSYAEFSHDAMLRVAECYALGKGTEKNIEKAKEWVEIYVRRALQQKVSVSSILGFSQFYCSNFIDFLTNGKYMPADYDKAIELALLLGSYGTEEASEMLSKIYERKEPGKTVDTDAMIADYMVICMAKPGRSKNAYKAYKDQIEAAGISGAAAEIEFLLKKAGYNVTVKDVTFPGATAETEAQFRNARAIEAKGQDFKQAAAAYEAPAMAGHTEAMRRLGILKRDVLNMDQASKDYLAGVEWLKKAANAGNALAAFDLGDKNADISFIAGLASMGNYDAIYALGCIVNAGWGVQGNWDMAQAFFRQMELMLGDPVAEGNGEGIEWLIRLGRKFGIMDNEHFAALADAGHEIGYTPCTAELCFMTDIMAKRAFKKHGNNMGAYGDFDYSNYVMSLITSGPRKAGIKHVAELYEKLQDDKTNFRDYQEKELKNAEEGKDTWAYAKFGAKERVARAAKSINVSCSAAYCARCQTGLNYNNISNRLWDNGEGDAMYNKVMRDLSYNEAKENAVASHSGTQSNTGFGSSGVKAFNFPSTLIDDQVNTWELQYSDNEKAEYRCRKTGDRTTIWCTGGYLNLPVGWRAN